MVNLTQPQVNDDREARAPYNFVPLPDRVVEVDVDSLPDQGMFNEGLHTGYFDCELSTSSPIYIRTGVSLEQAIAGKDSKDLPDFFYLNDKKQPVIPGSSLRGMLRSLVEIATFSKISTVSKTPLFYRSVGGDSNHDENYRSRMMKFDNKTNKSGETKLYTPLIRAGYMVKTGSRDWAIRPAKVIDGTTYAHISISKFNKDELTKVKNCNNAYEIFIKTGPYQYQEVKGGFLKVKFAKVLKNSNVSSPSLRPATLAISGWMFSKKSEAVVYEQDDKAELLPLTEEQIDNYILQQNKEQKDILEKNGVLNDGQPVFYLFDEKKNEVIFFGHARMFRAPYQHTPFNYVPDYAQSREEPLNPDVVDLTEAIFGFTRNLKSDPKNIYEQQKKKAYAGRVSFTDGLLVEDRSNIWLSSDPITPKVLASPKPTTFQHYLVQPEPNFYPSDRSKPETRLLDYDSPLDGQTTIRGYKFYWHKGSVELKEIEHNGNSKGNVLTKIHPLKEGVKFKFRIYFDNLNEIELGALTWVLNIASDENIRLKIGMAKPLGFGAIKIHAILNTSNPSERYAGLFSSGTWKGTPQVNHELSTKVLQAFLNSMTSELGKEFIKHPRIRALLIMLQWPGPDPEWTRYMEIERPNPNVKKGKTNEYDGRPVLPSPFGVWSKHKNK